MKHLIQLWHVAKSPVRSTSVLLLLLLCLRVDSCPQKCECQGNNEALLVDCSNKGLDTWPHGLPKDVTELDLSSNNIDILVFGTSDINTFPSLKKLNLKYNSVFKIDHHFFNSFPQLEELYLDNNKIETIDGNSFGSLTRLKNLHLQNNRLTMLTPTVFNNLTVEVLNLNDNNIQSIYPSAFHGCSIVKLFMDYNNIREISKTLLSPLQFTLKEFHLSYNGRALSISIDTFQGFDLDTLKLQYDGLHESSFLSSVSTRKLDLRGNELAVSLLGEYRTMNSVEELVLSNNSIEVLDSEYFRQFVNLRLLDLSHNKLSYLTEDTFKWNVNLETINLNFNKLWKFPEKLGTSCPRLKILLLEYNSVSTFEFNHLDGLYLEELNLSHNIIQVFNESLKQVFNGISLLSLGGNPLHCNCEMRWFKEWLAIRTSFTGLHKCHSPVKTGIDQLNLDQFICRPPKIVYITSSPVMADEGDNVELRCTAEGDPAPVIVFSDPGTQHISISPQNNRTKTKTYAFWQINDIQFYNSGYYTCKATNILGSIEGNVCISVNSSMTDDAQPVCPGTEIISSTESTTVSTTTTHSSSTSGFTTVLSTESSTSSSSKSYKSETTENPIIPTSYHSDGPIKTSTLIIVIVALAIGFISIVVIGCFIYKCAVRKSVRGSYTVSSQDDFLPYHEMKTTPTPKRGEWQQLNGGHVV